MLYFTENVFIMKNHYEIIGDTVKVYSNGKHKERHFFIDLADLEFISKYSFRVNPNRNSWRVETSITVNGKLKNFSLGRLFLNFPEGHYADHIDRNPLNNRRNNIRISTPSQNSFNSSKFTRATTSKYKGVCYHKHKKLWIASVSANKKRYHLGYFKNEIDAANAYDLKAKELHNDFAALNS